MCRCRRRLRRWIWSPLVFNIIQKLPIITILVLDRPVVKNEAHTVLHTTRVLNNNVRECMESTIKGNVNARDRPRHNEAEFATRELLIITYCCKSERSRHSDNVRLWLSHRGAGPFIRPRRSSTQATCRVFARDRSESGDECDRCADGA